MDAVFFYVGATLAVLSVILMIIQNHPVASAVYLILSFFGLAILYITLEAHFVAAMQILVYAGAIMVLFVFVIMLLNLKPDELSYDKLSAKSFGVGFLGLCLFGVLAFQFISKFGEKLPPGFSKAPDDFGSAGFVAKALFSDYVLPFEIMSFVLLVGLVGAILLGKKDA